MYWLILTGHFHGTTYCKSRLLLPNGNNQIRDKITSLSSIFCQLHWISLGILTVIPLTRSSADLPCQLSPSEPPKQLSGITKYPHVSTVSLFFRIYWTTEILMCFSLQWWAPHEDWCQVFNLHFLLSNPWLVHGRISLLKFPLTSLKLSGEDLRPKTLDTESFPKTSTHCLLPKKPLQPRGFIQRQWVKGYKYTRSLSWEELDKGYHCSATATKCVPLSLPGWDFCTKILLSTSIRVDRTFLKKFASGCHRIFWLHLRHPTSSWKLTGLESTKLTLHRARESGCWGIAFGNNYLLIVTPTVWIKKNATEDNLQPFKVYKAPKINFISKLIWEASERLVHGHKIHTSSLILSGKISK